MAVNSETEINLKTLQRVDSNIVEIIDNASQVAIYKFERKLNKWEGTDIEGTLFLYRRSLYPFHGFIIVNRMSTTNFVEVITTDMEFVLQEPYFLYKKRCGEIIGSWFYEEKDFRRITNKIQSIVLKQSTPPRRQRCSSDGESQLRKDDASQDIMSMLSEAHTEYVRTETEKPNSKRNIREDFNNVTTCTDKKIDNKSLNAHGGKSKNQCTRAWSEEKYPVSPRRRFLSTGSYDSRSGIVAYNRTVLMDLLNRSKKAEASSGIQNKQQIKDNSRTSDSFHIFPLKLPVVDIPSGPTRLSPLFSHDEIISPTLSGISILDQSVEPVEMPLKSHLPNSIIPNVTLKITSSEHKPNFEHRINNQKDCHSHSADLKDTLISHLEWDSDILLKIHEAYVASLKSAFSQKRN